MEVNEIVEQAVQLTPPERALVIEALLHSLDQPDAQIDEVWGDEAEARLAAIRDGRLGTVPVDQVPKPR